MEKIDSHQHFWHYDTKRFPWIGEGLEILASDFLPDQLHSLIQANEVVGTVAVQAVPEDAETEFLLDLAEEYPFILGVVGWIDLTSDQLTDKLHAYQPFPKLKGFRHLLQDETDPKFILKPAFQRGLAKIFEAGYSYDLLVLPHQLEGVIHTVENFPKGRFVLDHLAKPSIREREISRWKDKIIELSSYPQVSCKVSGMVTEADWQNWEQTDFYPYLDVVMDAFGEDRLLFGSDWPVCKLAASYQQVCEILESYLEGKPEAFQNKVWYENARKFYRL
ncbi:amidohydrolase family protein [Cyclobacterium jeungdonense]|uniref:Amidohydrolase family protein n=1 Tax=Cyclobacterium jeungdonense TaxID=708087 RepID=A0ABT8CC00_9BACT|nr:amidohydrolase family protein [Cyclobacterium jeungdonense]MDN3690319.1 amidohydrolase family protein [Cyclobacterium jeungdonense]